MLGVAILIFRWRGINNKLAIAAFGEDYRLQLVLQAFNSYFWVQKYWLSGGIGRVHLNFEENQEFDTCMLIVSRNVGTPSN